MDDNKCDYCNKGDAEMYLSIGSYGIDEPIRICASPECVRQATATMIDCATEITEKLAEAKGEQHV